MQTQLGSLPIVLVCFPNRTVLLAPMQDFKAIVDQCGDGSINAIFDMSGFSLYNSEKDLAIGLSYSYNVALALDDMPLLKKYLIQQEMTI